MPLAQNFSIVVLGSMNPRIHHPFFYHSIDAIGKVELDAALEGSAVTCLPQAAQFDIDTVRVVCLPDRWQVASAEESSVSRLLKIAQRSMTALEYTPVTAFGFNFDFARTFDRDLNVRFGAMARSLPLGFRAGEGETAAFTYASTEELDQVTRRTTLVVAPSPEQELSVKINRNYTVKLREKYELGDLFGEFFLRDYEGAREQLDKTVLALKAAL